LLTAVLGLSVRAGARQVRVEGPCLPRYLKTLHIRRLQLDGEALNLTFERDVHGEVSVVPTGLGSGIELVLAP
jgi:hypothetical protein